MSEAALKEGMWCHVEFTSGNPERARSFFNGVFGWKFTDMPQLSYMLYDTGPGGIGGGMCKAEAGQHPHVVNYILVDEIEPTLEKIERHGGKTVRPKTEVPGAGWLALFSDPDGIVHGLWKPAGRPS